MKEMIEIRSGLPEDKNFIYSTWLKGLYYGTECLKDIDQKAFFEHYKKVVHYLLHKPQTKIRIAVLKEDPSIILGYAILESEILHYVHVKEAWRKIGLAKQLINEEIKVITHLTDLGKILRSKIPNALFNPFMI